MVQTTSHIFTGRVEVESNLRVGTSHLFVDTANHRVGINEHDPDANLHVNGNAYISSDLTVGTNIHASGNVVAASFEGDGSLLTGIASNLEQIVNNGNVTSNTVQFTNSDTSIVTSGNVEVGGKLSVNSLTPGTVPYVDGNKTLVDSRITHGIDTVTITSNLEVTGNILMAGESYKIDSQSLEVKDRIIGIAYNNTLSGADTGILMEYPTKNVALVHHGASGNPYAQEFTIGYTQNTATDSTIVNDTTNVITVNVLGDLHTQNNMTVDSGGSYFGDGTTLTGVALETDMTSNAARIANIETVNGTQTGLITGLRTDMTSNAARVSTLEDANTVQAGLITTLTNDLSDNVGRITTLEAANTVQAGLITTLTNDLSDNAGRITTLEAANTVQAGLITAIETDVTGNAARITTLEAANTVQAGLITAIETDVTDNAARITTLEDANTVQAGLITAIETDVTDNAARITTLEDANTVQAGLITTIETDIADNAARITNLDTDLSDNASRVSVLEATDAVYAGLLMGLRTDVDDNDSRISNLTFNDVVNVNNATSNTVQFTNPTTALTTDLISNVGIKVDQLHNVNLVGPLADQLLVYDGTDWVNDYPRHTYIQIRNDTTGSIDAGDAVYVKGTHNANILNVGLADSSDPTKMPSVGLSNQLLTPGQQGTAVAYGKALSVATGTFVEGETVYVSNTVPGGLSNVKPFNNDLIQNIGLVTKIHPTNGAVFVTGIGRANDVPNAQIVLDEDAINYVYVNNVNNDFKKIEPSNLLTQLQTFEQVSAAGNVVSNTMEFNNVTTGLVTVANVEVGSNLSIAGITDPVNKHLPMVGLDGYLEKSPIYFAPDGTYVVSAAEAEFTGNLTLSGNTTIVSSTSVTIEDRIFGIGANNEVHNLDTGFMMEHKDGGVYANIALIYHADEHRFSVGYTQNTFADDHILHFEDEDHQMLVDLRGNVLVQNSLTVANGSYFGDGTTLTGVALSSDLTSNAARISNLEDSNVNIWSNLASNVIRISNLEASNVDIWSNLASNVIRISDLEAANTVQGGLITTLEGDVTSNALRISNLEASNVDIWSNLASNVIRISDLEAANTVQGGLITTIEGDVTSNAVRISNLEASNVDIWSNLASNVIRISDLEAANTVQGGLITAIEGDVTSNALRISNLEASNVDIWSNLASNVARIETLETANAVQEALITAIEGDVTSNALRISNLEASNVNIWSNLASNVIRISDLEAANTVQEGLITAIEGDVTSNALRISNLEASNVDIWSNLASNVTRIETLETANAVQEALITAIEGDMTSNAARIATLELANTVQELLITAIETDMTSNSGRIDALEPRVTNLEYSNAGIWSNLASNVTRIENLETSNANIWSNLASNVTRIGNLETNLSDNSSRIDALTLGDVVDVGNVTSNTVQFINATTSLVASGNVVVTGNVTSTTGRINKVATVGTTKTFVVTVSGGVFYIDGVQQDTLELHQYQTYIFDQSDASNATHPIRFSTTTNGTHNGGAEYQFGVSHTGTPGSTGAFTTFVVPVGAPSTLHYYCENHSGMGSSLSVSTLAELIVTGRTVVSGNVEASSFIGDGSQLTNIASNLQAITDNGNVTSNSIQFTNTGTSIKASGTIEAVSFTGDGSQLTGIATTLQAVSDNGNVTSNTILLSNVTTGLVADGNVHALKFIGDGSELSGITPTLSAVLDTGNTSSNTILLTNVTTGLVADGNVHALKFIGSGSELTDIATTLQAVSDNSNSTSNTLLLTNATTGLVADGNVHALKFIGDGSELQNLPNAGVWETNEEQEIYYTGNNVGISNANPGHNLSVGSNLYVDDTGSNVLVISGNAAMSSLTLGQFSIVASYGLDDILNTSNISSNTMQLTNATTGLVVSSNIVVTGNVTAAYLHGDASNVTGITSNLHQIAENGNVTSNTLQFTNATTGFVTTANVEVGGELTVSGNVAVDTDTLFVDSVNDRVGVGTSSPNANLHVEGNVYVSSNLKVDTTTISTLFVGLPTVSWATSIGGTGNDNGKEIATDSGGNVYVIGHYSGSVTIGSTTLTSVGSTDAFVAKYDTSGTVQWATSIGGTSNDFGYGITTDSGGNVYVIGSYIGTVTIGSTTLTNTDTYDAFVAKYDTSGTVQWATSIGGTGSEDGYDIATDSSGNVYVTGIYLGTVTIGSTTLTSTSSYDAFVVKYDTSGTVQWAKSIGGSAGPDYGYGIATDSSGNVYVIGRYYGNTITFAPGTTLTNTNQDDTGGEFATTDVFVVKYDTSGTVQWARGFGGSNNDLGYGIATDSSGNVYVTGKFYGSSVTIGSTTLTGSNFDNAFVAKYDTSGTVQWARGISGATAGDGIATDSGGNVYVIGHYSGSVTIGSTTLTSVGSADVFVAKYDTSGTVQWARSIGGTSTDFGYGIATDSGGNVYVIGTYGGTVTFASGTTLTSTGSYDAFVAKYSQPKYLHINTGIEVGTANLSVDTVSGRVGIGTATPRTNLHIGQQLNSQGDKNTIPAAGLGISADFPSSTHAWFAHRVNATGDEYWGLAVGTIYDGASYLQNLNKNSGTYYDLLLQPNGGNVGIGTTDPGAKFQVNGLGFADVANSSRSYFLYSSTGLTQNTGTWGNASIYATDSIVTGSYIASIQGTVGASDERIKKEVSDINDGSALETLRLLKPKQYKYKDEISRGTDPVWGFIAQEVRETLPYATQIRSEYLPNIYELATVSSSNVITFTNFNTSNLMSNANTISLRTVKGTSERVNIVEVVDEQTIRVDKDLSESIGSVDESGNVMTGNEIFVYGQEVDDFVYLKKDAIWTIATAALQEVDRQLQTEKARNDDLEARILALENA